MTTVATRPAHSAATANPTKLESWLDYLPLVQLRADGLLEHVSMSNIDCDNETLYRLPRIALKTLQNIRAEMAREKVDEAIYDASALIVAAMATAEADSPAFTSLHQALDLVHGLMYAHEPNTRPINFDEVKKALALPPVGTSVEARERAEVTRKPEPGAQDDRRLNIARDATHEIDAILRLLRRTRHDNESFLDVFNGLSLRLLALNRVAISVLSDDADFRTEEMQAVVRGADA